eukprot:CAMPEP_0116891804 /NCGR_PEP_ID=MMETSP0467-20121206/2143_1 /TAXON_ID=283647 /ORGANISM="Mesodinium pulex, Strain SPMC105" /LENGTH=59 /DNA_ID=CAMNT_0004560531 /DNA_START=38 /DNA_END=217 /DNA_ORIENTATION=+
MQAVPRLGCLSCQKQPPPTPPGGGWRAAPAKLSTRYCDGKNRVKAAPTSSPSHISVYGL